jgi:hypothetical protein
MRSPTFGAAGGNITSVGRIVATKLAKGIETELTRGAGCCAPPRNYLMAKPAAIEIVRRAYALWQQAGEPEGRDQDFYLEAEKELQENDEDGVGPEPTIL